MERITGLTKEAVLGKHVWAIQHNIMSPDRQSDDTENDLERIWKDKVHILNPGEIARKVGKISNATG